MVALYDDGASNTDTVIFASCTITGNSAKKVRLRQLVTCVQMIDIETDGGAGSAWKVWLRLGDSLPDAKWCLGDGIDITRHGCLCNIRRGNRQEDEASHTPKTCPTQPSCPPGRWSCLCGNLWCERYRNRELLELHRHRQQCKWGAPEAAGRDASK